MKSKEADKLIQFEDAWQMPEFAHLHDILRYVENAHDSELSPKKYQMILEDNDSKTLKNLFNKKPKMAIKDVVMAVFVRLPNDIPSAFVLKITPIIIEGWNKKRIL